MLNIRKIICSCFACLIATGCGADPVTSSVDIVPVVGSEVDALTIDASALSADTTRRLVETYDRLEVEGVLDDDEVWDMRKPAKSDAYVEVQLKDDRERGIIDGFRHKALIPAGTKVRNEDPNRSRSFFVQRVGGFAGMSFMAGPFSLDR